MKIENFKLKIAQDAQKDQSYFLWTLTQKELKHCLFPIGTYQKPKVRAMAARAGLPTAAKKDSQGICFLGNINLAEFLKMHIPEKKGAVLTASGEAIGEHTGAAFYTIGQRHIGVGNNKERIANGNAKPLYVAEKDVKKNTLTVAEAGDPLLLKKEIQLTNVNLISSSHLKPKTPASPAGGSHLVYARVRYRQPLVSAKLSMTKGGRYTLTFDTSQQFIAAGQSAVWYSKEGEMLGGGIIQ